MPAYIAVTPAESSPYTSARLIMTSIAYSPCLRIATVMAAGNPNSARTGHHGIRRGDHPRGGAVVDYVGERGSELAGQYRHPGKREPLDLLACFLPPGAVADDQRHERRRKQRDQQHRQPAEGSDEQV
jgi:hypothetical protein